MKTLLRRFDVIRLKGFLSTTILFVAGHRHGLDRTLVFTAGYNVNADGDARLRSATSVIDCIKNVLRPSFCKRDMHFETRKRAVNVPSIEDTLIVVIVPYARVTVKVLRSQFHAIMLYRVLYCDDRKTIDPLINYHIVRSKIRTNLVKLYRIDRDL